MIILSEAQEILYKNSQKLKTEVVKLHQSLGRVLATDIYSDIDMPSFSKSAMDGFAIQKESLHKEWEQLEFVPAGKKPSRKIGPLQCSRVMTGGMLPAGADMVVMIEHTEQLSNAKVRFVKKASKSNVLMQGEDLKKGELVLKKGQIIKPAHIAIMAGAGILDPLVYKQPKIAILATGTELVEPKEIPIPPFIRNTNSYHIQALCTKEGVSSLNAGIIADDAASITEKIENLMTTNDLIIFTGGASFGDHDFSKEVMENLGAELHFQKLAIQPGKPVLFATKGDKYLFGLSGNPVSSSVQFMLLVKPLLHHIMGQKEGEKVFSFPMACAHNRRKTERDLFFPATINRNAEITPVDYHGSAHVSAYEQADVLVKFPIGISELKKGDLVDVRFL